MGDVTDERTKGAITKIVEISAKKIKNLESVKNENTRKMLKRMIEAELVKVEDYCDECPASTGLQNEIVKEMTRGEIRGTLRETCRLCKSADGIYKHDIKEQVDYYREQRNEYKLRTERAEKKLEELEKDYARNKRHEIKGVGKYLTLKDSQIKAVLINHASKDMTQWEFCDKFQMNNVTYRKVVN